MLVQHGLASNGSHWLFGLDEDDMSFPVVMMEEGYDVWLGNNRGSSFSLGHVKKSFYREKYWDFSWAEMGKYDVASFTDYIYEATGNQKLIYFGHSQGTT